MKIFHINQLAEGLRRGVKRGIAMLLVFIMTLTVFTSLGLYFDLPSLLGLRASAATDKSQTVYDNIVDFQKAEFQKIQESILAWDYGSIQDPSTMSTYLSRFTKEGNPYFNWTTTGLTGDKVWNNFASNCQSELIADSIKTINGLEYGVFNVESADEFYQACYMTTRSSAQAYDPSVGFVNTNSQRISVRSNRNPTADQQAQYPYRDENTHTEGSYGATYYYWYADPYVEAEGAHGHYGTKTVTNYLINLLTDLDMGGNNTNVNGTNNLRNVWTPIQPQTTDQTQRVYIEGNGHTVYNLKISTLGVWDPNTNLTGLSAMFAYSPYYFAVKNLGFHSTVSISTATRQVNSSNNPTTVYDQVALLAAFVGEKIYLDNVHSDGAYFQAREVDPGESSYSCGIGGLIGRKQNNFAPTTISQSGDNYIINCSTSNYIIYGGPHIGGLTSYIGCSNVTPDTDQTYDSELPSYDEMFKNAMSADTAKYPWVILNSSSTDSTIFSTAADSGSFISCGDSIIAKNCFSNNTIYARRNTGGFIGRSATIYSGTINDANNNANINSYFRDCYSTGIVEGTVAMGGFIGLDMGYRSQNDIEKATATNQSLSCDIFENCFSTAMVGMDYSGKYCGGFAGLDDNYYDGTTYESITYFQYNGSSWGGRTAYRQSSTNNITVNVKNAAGNDVAATGNGTWYINCYAAGEVGNILTVTDTDKMYHVDSSSGAVSGYEREFFRDSQRSNRDHSNYEDPDTDILDYYPTGGFIGAINIDKYYAHEMSDSSRNYKVTLLNSNQNYDFVWFPNGTSYSGNTIGNATGTGSSTIKNYIRQQLGQTSTYYSITTSDIQRLINEGKLFMGFQNNSISTSSTVKDKPFGNFYNCMYDMQTTAMREIAIGMAKPEVSGSPDGSKTVSSYFALPGVTGVYTADSTKTFINSNGNYVDTDGNEINKAAYDANPASYSNVTLKTMPGLTDLKTMGSDWTYTQQYYPQLSSMMVADMTKSSIKQITAADINNAESGHNAAESPFFIANSSETNVVNASDPSKYRKPVLSNATVQQVAVGLPYDVTDEKTGTTYKQQDYKPEVQDDFTADGGNVTAAAQMSEVVKAYRYSQAATATVFLDHWDLTMNTKTGDTDNQGEDLVPALDRNAMKRTGKVNINGKEVDEWSITYTGLSADTYVFKVNAGDTLAFSYGSKGFARNDDNIELKVTEPNSTVTIRFAFNELNTDYYYIYADVTPPGGETTTIIFHDLPQEYQPDPKGGYVLAGNIGDLGATNASSGKALPNWDPTYDTADKSNVLTYDASRTENVSGSDRHYYTLTLDMPGDSAGTAYEYKVTYGDWNTNWGVNADPGGDNMTLTLTDDTKVTFIFCEETKLMTLEFDKPNNAVAYNCGEHFAKKDGGGVEGYSVLAQSDKIGANVNWYINNEDGLLDAAKKGLMTANEDETEFTYAFTLSGADIWNKNYAYKIIKDGVDEGANQCFYLGAQPEGVSSANFVIHYYPLNTGNARFNVTCDNEDVQAQVEQIAKYDKYGVTGTAELFGAWSSTPQQQGWNTSENLLLSPSPSDEHILQYKLDGIFFSERLGYTDQKLPAGTYSFKVVADNSWESGLDYGDAKGKNYTFNLVQPADQIIISFDPRSELDCKITVDVSPTTALDTNNYVVTASAALAGLMGVEEWKKSYEDAQSAFLDWVQGDGLFEKWVLNVPSNDNIDISEWSSENYPVWAYGFKVIKVDNDNGEPNLRVELTKSRSYYDMFITYNEGDNSVTVYAFEQTGNTSRRREDALGWVRFNQKTGEVLAKSTEADTYIVGDPEPKFYAILGEEALTGYNWSGNFIPSAKRGLLVPANDGSGLLHLSEPYRVSGIKSQTQFGTSYSFKVSAAGTWDLSYPDQNAIVTVAYPQNARSTSVWAADECEIDIYFDPNTHDIDHYTAFNGANQGTSYLFELDDEKLNWFIAPTNKLFDQNMFSNQENVTVYDTVRDITSGFYFTYGAGSEQRGMMVESDVVRNNSDGFYDLDEFKLEYTMKEHYLNGADQIERYDLIGGTFTADVIDLKNRTFTHDVAKQLEGNEKDSYEGFVLEKNNLLTKFYVEQFAPGKQWLKINTVGYGYSDEYNKWQQQFLKYTSYTEDKEKFGRYEKLFLQLCSSFPYRGSKVNEFTLYDYLNERKADSSDEVYASMVEAFDYDLLEHKADLEARAAAGDSVEPSTVFDSNTQFIVGSRDLRLIPSSYLEAGVDANINVVQKAGDDANALNSVRLNYNDSGYKSDDYSFTAQVIDNWTEKFNGPNLDEISFGYYNYAVTSAYLSTDKIGLGIYNNYDDQFMSQFNGDYRRDDDDSTKRNSNPEDGTPNYVQSPEGHRYFAMMSAYDTETDDDGLFRFNYNDDTKFDENDYTKRTFVNLNAGYFNDMSIVGSTYDRNKNDGKEDAQTLVKIYKVDTDANGNYITKADGSYQTTPVYFSNNTAASTTYANNYKKWSGLTNFTAGDTGYYEVQFNWVLSDGRYIQDSKYVDIKLVEPGITKTVSTEYETAGKNMLTYTIKYTNYNTELLVDFAILDILPFAGDVRFNEASGRTNNTNLSPEHDEINFKLQSVVVQQSSKSDVREIYYTSSTGVRDWLSKDDGEGGVTTDEEAAKNLTLQNDGYIADSGGVSWTALGQGDSSLHKYKPGRYTKDASGNTLNADATAVCISGMQLATGQDITVEFTFEFDGKITDYYSNDAFYYIRATESSGTEDAGMSRPVGTAIVSRDLTGFAWYDTNGNGIINNDEPKIENMEVQLYKQVEIVNPETGAKTTNYLDTGLRETTDSNGKYTFSNIEDGYYQVRFVNPGGGDALNQLTINGLPASFGDLRGTTKLQERNEDRNAENVKEKGYTTRNLATATQTNPEERIEANKKFAYTISGIYMPSNSLVYSNNNNSTLTNATDINYLYTRMFQNAGFGSVHDVLNQYSIDIHKVNEDDEPLENVQFALEYLNPNNGLWYPVHYKTVGEGTALETTVMDSNFPAPAGALGDYTAESWPGAVVEKFEADEQPENSRAVYIIDKTGSESLNMHYWGTENTDWPGKSLRKYISGNDTNVYRAYIPDGTNGIIFNNGSIQTDNIEARSTIDNAKSFTLTVDGGKIVATPNTEVGFKEVYLVNTDPQCKEFYLWSWGSSIYNASDDGNVWPGVKISKLTENLYSALIPTDAGGIIFTGKDGDTQIAQTVNIEGTDLTNGKVFTLGDLDEGKYTYTTDIVASGKQRVYFVNDEWNEAALYAWGTPNNIFGEWPGSEMTKAADGVFYVDIPTFDGTQHLIFNNNDHGKQSPDLDVDNSDSLAKVYKIDEENGQPKVKEVTSGNTSAENKPTRKIYFTNNYNWDGDIYVQTIGGAAPSGEDGIKMDKDYVNDYGEQMYSAQVPKDSTSLVFMNKVSGSVVNKTTESAYSDEAMGWFINGRQGELSPEQAQPSIFITDADGNIELNKLLAGKYRITEVKTQDDYLLYNQPIEFDLPFTIKKSVLADANADYEMTLNEEFIEGDTDGDYLKYKHLGLEVTNHKQQFDLPLTGRSLQNLWWLLIIGLAIFSIAALMFYFVFKKRDKLQAVKIPVVESVVEKIKKGK